MKVQTVTFFLLLTLFVAFCQSQIDTAWTICSEMPVPVAGGQAISFDDKIYIFGGYSDSTGSPVDLVQQFDPYAQADEQWQVVGHMRFPRSHFVARVNGDKVYIAGGTTGFEERNVKSMEIWSFGNDAFECDENINLNRINATGEIVDNFFYIFGGYVSGTLGSLPYIIAFSLTDKTVVFIDEIFEDISPYFQCSASLDNMIYIFGGVRFGVTNRIYSFDAYTRKLLRIYPDIGEAKARAGSVALTSPNEGDIYIIGGYSESNDALNLVEKLHISWDGSEISEIFPLNEERKELMAAELNGTFYVFGGKNGRGDVIASVEKLGIYSNSQSVVQDKNIDEFDLFNNFPNPFNSYTTISFTLKEQSDVVLDIFSLRGEKVLNLVNDNLNSGFYKVVWSGRDDQDCPLPSGLYIYQLTTNSETKSKKMLLIK